MSNFLDQNNPKSKILEPVPSVQFHLNVDLYEYGSEWSSMRAKKTKESPVGLSQKWSQSLTGVVAYESTSLQSLSHSSNGVSQR